MRLAVLCPHFEPDVAPTGVVMTAIAEELASLGHEISVVTSLPWYREHRVEDAWRKRPVRVDRLRGGISVTRVNPFATSKTHIAARLAGFAGFTTLASAVGLVTPRPEAVLVMSPPITLGIAGVVVARRFRVPLVLNIQDIFPDAAIETGAVHNQRLIDGARRLERWLYRHSDAVTVLSEDMRTNIAAKTSPEHHNRIRVIPNFADPLQVRPRSRNTRYRAEHHLGDRTVVMYAGNVGLSQPFELMVAAAQALQSRDDVVFVINGGGSGRPALEAQAAGLPNLVLVDFQPPERLAEVLASADLHVILLRRGLAHSSVPSKLYTILASGRPVVASVDRGTELYRVLVEGRCGKWVPAEDTTAFIEAIESLIDDVPARAAMSQRARSVAERLPTAADVAAQYHDLLCEVIAQRR